MTKISELPAKERAQRYRHLAFEAKRDAALAKGPERDAFMKMAGHWQQLAAMAEQEGEEKP